jgi:hypothetical protein
MCELHRDPKKQSEPFEPKDFDPFAEDDEAPVPRNDKYAHLPVLPEEDFKAMFR